MSRPYSQYKQLYAEENILDLDMVQDALDPVLHKLFNALREKGYHPRDIYLRCLDEVNRKAMLNRDLARWDMPD